ncbi:hypothetical protein ACFB49_20100 [Sphingomonas sp. DBB INV C78]|uniref:hypothetical protein n=1 Tax=Sphingomonas sp. DBB INV C78 TaxID=3349434 RepID=UPI0036D2403F
MTEPAIPSAPAATAVAIPTKRLDGWTADRQRDFLAAVAEGHTVEAACRIVGLSVASAYAFRRRASGAAFALGWQAACLQAREKLADILLSRAIDGQTETITRANGDVIERHRYDNRLATAMLTRMDRLADSAVADGTHHAARLIAQEWDQYLDIIGRDGGPARAGLFLGVRVGSAGAGAGDGAGEAQADLAPVIALARADRWLRSGVSLAGDVDVRDLDVDARSTWTGEQWARAEAAGLVHIAPPQAEVEDANGNPQLPQLEEDEEDYEDRDVWPDKLAGGQVHYCFKSERWRTYFPPPPGFCGTETGEYGDDLYERTLSRAELDALLAMRAEDVAARCAAESAERDGFFGFVPDADAVDEPLPASQGRPAGPRPSAEWEEAKEAQRQLMAALERIRAEQEEAEEDGDPPASSSSSSS